MNLQFGLKCEKMYHFNGKLQRYKFILKSRIVWNDTIQYSPESGPHA